MELSSSNVKKFLIFSKNKAFLIFRETEIPKKIRYISENGNPPKISYIPGNKTF